MRLAPRSRDNKCSKIVTFTVNSLNKSHPSSSLCSCYLDFLCLYSYPPPLSPAAWAPSGVMGCQINMFSLCVWLLETRGLYLEAVLGPYVPCYFRMIMWIYVATGHEDKEQQRTEGKRGLLDTFCSDKSGRGNLYHNGVHRGWLNVSIKGTRRDL